MNAKFNFYNGNIQQTQRPVESVQEARGLAKKTLRRLGSTSWGNRVRERVAYHRRPA